MLNRICFKLVRPITVPRVCVVGFANEIEPIANISFPTGSLLDKILVNGSLALLSEFVGRRCFHEFFGLWFPFSSQGIHNFPEMTFRAAFARVGVVVFGIEISEDGWVKLDAAMSGMGRMNKMGLTPHLAIQPIKVVHGVFCPFEGVRRYLCFCLSTIGLRVVI